MKFNQIKINIDFEILIYNFNLINCLFGSKKLKIKFRNESSFFFVLIIEKLKHLMLNSI